MDFEQYLIERRKSIGGSDIAAVVGRHPFKSARSLAMDKLGMTPLNPEPSGDMKRGITMEPIIRQMMEAQTGNEITIPENRSLLDKHPKLPIHASVDGYWHQGIVEIKAPRSWTLRKMQETGIPDYIHLQGQHNLGVVGGEICRFGFLDTDNWNVVIVDVERDQAIIDELQQAADEFWNDYIVPGILPDEVDEDGLAVIEPAKGVVTVDDGEWEARIERLRDAYNLKNVATELYKRRANETQKHMTSIGAHKVIGFNASINFSATKPRVTVDTKALTVAYEAVCAELAALRAERGIKGDFPLVKADAFKKTGKPGTRFAPYFKE